MKKRYLLTLVLVFVLSFNMMAGAVTLNFLEVMTSPERTNLLKEMIAEFEAANPNIEVNLISPPYEQADQKATMMLNTNQKLDVVEVRDYTIKQFVNNGKLLDLTDYYANWEGDQTLSNVAKTASTIVENTPYIVPQSIFIKALFVRDDILAEHGINYAPKTFSELIEISRQITDPKNNQYAFAWRGKGSEHKFSDLFASAYVKEIKDGEFIYSEDETFFTDENYKLGMEAYIDLFDKGVPNDGVNWGFNEQVNGFVSGVTPFLIQDPDAVPLIDKMLGADKYSVVPVPVGPYGHSYLDFGFIGLGIPSYSENKEEAWKFMTWLLSAEKNGYFNQNYGALPVHTTTFEENEYFQGEHYKAFNYEMNNTDKFIFKEYPLASSKWPGWSQIHESDMQSLLLGNKELDEVLEDWDAYWTE